MTEKKERPDKKAVNFSMTPEISEAFHLLADKYGGKKYWAVWASALLLMLEEERTVIDLYVGAVVGADLAGSASMRALIEKALEKKFHAEIADSAIPGYKKTVKSQSEHGTSEPKAETPEDRSTGEAGGKGRKGRSK